MNPKQIKQELKRILSLSHQHEMHESLSDLLKSYPNPTEAIAPFLTLGPEVGTPLEGINVFWILVNYAKQESDAYFSLNPFFSRLIEALVTHYMPQNPNELVTLLSAKFRNLKQEGSNTFFLLMGADMSLAVNLINRLLDQAVPLDPKLLDAPLELVNAWDRLLEFANTLEEPAKSKLLEGIKATIKKRSLAEIISIDKYEKTGFLNLVRKYRIRELLDSTIQQFENKPEELANLFAQPVIEEIDPRLALVRHAISLAIKNNDNRLLICLHEIFGIWAEGIDPNELTAILLRTSRNQKISFLEYMAENQQQFSALLQVLGRFNLLIQLVLREALYNTLQARAAALRVLHAGFSQLFNDYYSSTDSKEDADEIIAAVLSHEHPAAIARIFCFLAKHNSFEETTMLQTLSCQNPVRLLALLNRSPGTWEQHLETVAREATAAVQSALNAHLPQQEMRNLVCSYLLFSSPVAGEKEDDEDDEQPQP